MEPARPGRTDASEQLLDAMPDGIFMVDVEGRITRLNQRAESLSGYTRGELLTMAVEALVPDMLRAGHAVLREAYMRRPAARSMGSHLDIQFRRKDGSEFPADIALSPVMTPEGVRVVASVRDITERRRAEEAVVQAEQRFRLAVEEVRDYAILMLDVDGHIATWGPGAERLSGYAAGDIVGRHFSVLYPPDDIAAGHPDAEVRNATATGRFEVEGWRLRKDGTRFWATVVVSAVRDSNGKLTGFAKVIRDVTARKRQDDRLVAVLEVAQATIEGRGQQDLHRLIAHQARSLTEAALAMVLLVDPQLEMGTVEAADGPQAEAVVGSVLPLAGTVASGVLATGKPVALGSASPAQAEAASMPAAGAGGPSLMVRLASGEHVIGVLSVSNGPEGRQFTDADTLLLQLFAAQAAISVDYARIREEVQRLAVLEDRERIGRELHDGAIQALFSVGMGLQGLAMMTTDTGLRGRLEASVSQIDEVIRDLRNYIFGLRPGLSADRTLERALLELAGQLEEQYGIACAVDVDEALAARLASRSPDIVQVAREALANVGRHSGAATCRLSLRTEAGQAVLEVDDDGHGFEPDQSSHGGWGLQNLRERAAALGGSLDITSTPADGTAVRLRIPT